MLSAAAAPATCAAVVKADAYGLGASEIAAALEAAGCDTFFVAHLDEGISLRHALGEGARIFVLNGTPPGTEADFAAEKLIPVVNTSGELSAWRANCRAKGRSRPVALQFDSGMTRFGLTSADVSAIAAIPAMLEGLSIELAMSHLACADDPDHAANEAQRQEFERLRGMLPDAPASLANSSGIFLGSKFHFDLTRPGAALYGVNPTPHAANPMQAAVRVNARVLQLREVRAGTGVGYGHTACCRRRSRLATISLGYADGWPRNACAAAFFRGQRLPFLGRVSMDSIVIDATGCAEPPREGDFVEVIGPSQTVDDVAAAAGTIGYEILTRLGHRFHRRYLAACAP
jgi:alanine racemase